ncbi:vacuolar-sorting receptor 3 [Physcomitrium patens]|uniref:Uncharacterized protein n=1 Tax=Physcomitrium patens TaxID=3218 RepID=A0A2K1JTB5_PHYPA|nr:vacuolar-sorting receptor 3-like [Physcomitrium patens]XP_024389092.1 vacuolar-sorting receptor 3-like [Physcomitrium patens]PNR44760.1 hypothetical protein PHYPA_014530 [Physcomitrium patens]|eukprot:XP_024389091.1 vacuolar-sorting receptor 3-like [Physcomitrella patens]
MWTMGRCGCRAVAMVVLLLLAVPAWSTFVVEESALMVTSPESLKGKHQSAIGNFGVPQYGGTLSGTVSYPSVNSKACEAFPTDQFKSVPGQRPVFALVDRGDCYFATKVWYAQQAGAAAVLVADNKQEKLITMDSPEEDPAASQFIQNITIPSALITKDLGDSLKKALSDKEMVSIKLDWRESLPHPDKRVEYEFWTNSNDECGPKCDAQVEFVRNYKGVAQMLEQGGYTQFTPHYITWYCPQAFIESKQCKSQCINNGRYCAPDPEQDFSVGYDGKQVVIENLRQLCVFKVTNDTGKPWKWWDFVTDFQIRCPMKEKKYGPECAEEVIKSLSIDVGAVQKCMGDPNADQDHPILKHEQDAQVGQGDRGDVTILPTLIINNRQYRGKLDKSAVLKAICSGFEEASDPPACLSDTLQTNECLENNGGCWSSGDLTACQDTFRGRVCQCPLVKGVQFEGDGYTHCEAKGPGRCKIGNGECWQENRDGVTKSACQDDNAGCKCPVGFEGDGKNTTNGCVDINECTRRTKCQCPDCTCTNTWGGYDCQCGGDLLYIGEHDTCISKQSQPSKLGWFVTLIVLAGLAVLGVGAYVVYKYRLRSYMDSEIRAIMAQYMPLDSQNESQNHMADEI